MLGDLRNVRLRAPSSSTRPGSGRCARKDQLPLGTLVASHARRAVPVAPTRASARAAARARAWQRGAGEGGARRAAARRTGRPALAATAAQPRPSSSSCCARSATRCWARGRSTRRDLAVPGARRGAGASTRPSCARARGRARWRRCGGAARSAPTRRRAARAARRPRLPGHPRGRPGLGARRRRGPPSRRGARSKAAEADPRRLGEVASLAAGFDAAAAAPDVQLALDQERLGRCSARRSGRSRWCGRRTRRSSRTP